MKTFWLEENLPDWVLNIYYGIRQFFKNIKRLFVYAPIIWKHRNYDYSYTLRLLRFDLKKLRICIESGLNVDKSKLSKKIKIAEELLKRLEFHEGTFYLYEKHHDKWYKDDDIFKINSRSICEQERKEFKRVCDKQDELERYYKKYLFKLLEKHIQTWWD